MTTLDRATPLDRFLWLFADVRAGEGWLAVLLALNGFLILTSAKQPIDSFFFRMGDVESAGIVFVGTSLGFTAIRFVQLNVVLATMFLVLAVLVGRAYAGRNAMPTVAVRTQARQALA